MSIVIEVILAFLALLTQVSGPVETPQGEVGTATQSWAAPLKTDGFDGIVWVCDPTEAGDYDVEAISDLDAKELREIALDPENDLYEVCYYGHDVEGNIVEGPG